MIWEVRHGDATERLREMQAGSVQCCVTSPPYFGLRDYGVDGQIGLEATPDEYVAGLVLVFREIRRVLRADGTVWLNVGDSYASSWPCNRPVSTKDKDLIGVPWMLAFALRADGWWLRSDVIWAKPNPMPESVTDRPTQAHEHVFLLTKAARYFYDAEAIREPASSSFGAGPLATRGQQAWNGASEPPQNDHSGWIGGDGHVRNRRNVWEIPTRPYPEAHFATFPTRLVEPCVLAGTRMGDLVLDPFAGSGTVGVVCGWYERAFVGIELNAEYCELARKRILTEGRIGSQHKETAVIDGQMMLL